MIRILVCGAPDAACRQCALKVREAELEACSDPSQLQSQFKASDAVVFVGSVLPKVDVIERILGERKHVLLATEVFLSADVLATLSQTARHHCVQFALENPERHLPSRRIILQQLDSGKVGLAGFIRLHRWEPSFAKANCNPLDIPAALVRDIELASWFMDGSPNRVYATGQAIQTADGTSGRYLQVHLDFSGNGMALIDYSDGLPPGDGYQSFSLIGSAGAAYADDHQNMQLVFRGGHPQAVRTDEGTEALTTLVQEFVYNLRSGVDLAGDVDWWQRIWSVVDAVRRSLTSRQAIAPEGH